MQYDVTKVGFLEASQEKLSELESMTKYLNDMISKYLSVPDGIYASSSASRESSDSLRFR